MNTSKYSSAKKVLNMLGVSEINFGKLLKNHRLGEELTLAQMSKVLKISISHLSDIENERKFVSLERAKYFAKKLHQNEKYFILVVLRDQLKRANCDYKIELKAV
jgi:transcriptional regulator with XRE-family HTH domain